MRTKDKLLELLQNHSGEWYSGEEIAASLAVSRAAIWKAAMSLRNDGYIIDAVRNRGYRLSSEADNLSELGIWKYLRPECRMLDIRLLQEVGSTNVLLREKADAGYPEGTVLIASTQTDGRGRLGRKFYSPAETGLYMSLLLRPGSLLPEQAVRLTTIAAVAVCEAVEAASGKQAEIKWVNDIFVDRKKVCGILTEGSISMESGGFDYVILGIGINVYQPQDGFPAEIVSTAGAVFDRVQKDQKNILAAGILNRFIGYYLSGNYDRCSKEYRKRSMVIGREISLSLNGKQVKALAVDVDQQCRLVVKYENGETACLTAGDISVKME